MPRPTKSAPPPAIPARGTHTVKSLDQARALVDPLRVRILQEFVDAPRTTKQVAERLGEKPTRLYRHVDALVDAGLLALKAERRKRGTVERYFQAVASRFEIDRSLFAASREAGDAESRRMIRSLFERSESEVLDALAQCRADDPLGPLVLRADIRGGEVEVSRLREKLLEWIEECNALRGDERPQPPSGRRFGALVAFFPVSGGSPDS